MGNTGFYITLAVIVGLFVVMVMMQSKRRRAAYDQYNGMIESLRPGMRVKTVGGVLGKIVEMREEVPGFKTVLIETGTEKNPTFVLYEMNSIYGLVDDEAIAKRKQELAEQEASIENHNPADKGVDKTNQGFEAEKGKDKSK